MDKTEQKLQQAQQKLNEATVAGDESERWVYFLKICARVFANYWEFLNIHLKSVRKSLESRNVSDVERLAQLEKAIKDSQLIAEESERRFDETSKKVDVMESDLERTYERADSGEA